MRDPRNLKKSYRQDIDRYFLEAAPVQFQHQHIVGIPQYISWSLSTLRSRVRSPLEALLGIRMIEAFSRRKRLCWDPRSPGELGSAYGTNYVTFCSNLRVDTGTFDFWIRSSVEESAGLHDRIAVVECDGKAWHWGRQIDLDRRKDELAAEFGWCMFRISSDVILKDPQRCAEEIVEFSLDGTFQVPGLTMTKAEFRSHVSET